MRLWALVFEGDFVSVSDGAGKHIAWLMAQLREGRPGTPSWPEVDEAVLARALPIDTTPETRIGDLAVRARQAAQERGLARTNADGDADLLSVELVSAVSHSSFDDSWTVADAELTDGDLVVLCIEWNLGIDYELGPATSPRFLFETLELAANVRRLAETPRLWGALLYTDEDSELAVYVRTHFDELNALSGPLLSIFVVERPQSWASAKRYWREHLEPPLFRTFSALRWLFWKPYDSHQCYEIARRLGVDVALFPCLVLFRGTDPTGPLVFPIESVTPAYLRGLFGAIERVAGQQPRRYDLREALEESRGVEDGPSHDAWPDPGLGALAAMRSARSTDRAAFDRVAAAHQRIVDELRQVRPSNTQVHEFHGYTVFTSKGEPALTENFNFYGQTTFINRPVDTVIRDFQNSCAPTPEREQLAELLRLVLTSNDLPDEEKAQAAEEIRDITEEAAADEKDRTSIAAKLSTLRRIVTKAADIAEPALAISSRLIEMF